MRDRGQITSRGRFSDKNLEETDRDLYVVSHWPGYVGERFGLFQTGRGLAGPLFCPSMTDALRTGYSLLLTFRPEALSFFKSSLLRYLSANKNTHDH